MKVLKRDLQILKKELFIGIVTLLGMNLIFMCIVVNDTETAIVRIVLTVTINVILLLSFIVKYIKIWRPSIHKAFEKLREEQQMNRALEKYESLRKKFN